MLKLFLDLSSMRKKQKVPTQFGQYDWSQFSYQSVTILTPVIIQALSLRKGRKEQARSEKSRMDLT